MIEDVVDELKNLLTANLPPELAVESLPPIRRILIAEEDVPPAQLPVLFLLVQTTEEFRNIGPTLHDEEHALLIVALHQNVDTQKLARELMSYKNAIRRVFMRDLPQNPLQFIFDRRVIRHAYSRTREIEEGGAYSREVHLEVRLKERVNEI
jgi:hypothetical protein